MKKIVSVLLSLILIFSLSVTAFATTSIQSPVAEEKVTIIIRKANGTKSVVESDVKYTINKGDEVTVAADEATYGTFDAWSVYKIIFAEDGSILKVEPAVEGVDFTITAGNAGEKTFSILALTDLIICGNYDGKITDPLSGSDVEGTQADTSPTTSDNGVLVAVLAVASLSLVIVSKKQFCK